VLIDDYFRSMESLVSKIFLKELTGFVTAIANNIVNAFIEYGLRRRMVYSKIYGKCL